MILLDAVLLIPFIISDAVASNLLDIPSVEEKVITSTLIYDDAVDNRMLLVDPSGTVEELASTEDDVRYTGVAVEAGKVDNVK